ncbi:MAG: type II secretion system protein [Candidatus Falkowbacteria bacterium]
MNFARFIKKTKEPGFTLVEVLVVVAILSSISALTLSLVVTGFKATRFEAEQAEAIAHARNAISVMKKEIRGANSSEQGSYALDSIEEQEFVFYADIDADDRYEKVRYYLDDLDLIREVTEPGALNDYSEAPASTTIAQFVNNQEENIFTFYNSSYNIASTTNEVRLININLKINVTPETAPKDVYVESDVTLRNLKSNL